MVMDRSLLAVVCDAGPVIHLHELEALDLLSGYQPLMIPTTVSVEITQHRMIAFSDFRFTIVADPQPAPALREIQRIFCLHKGEVAALGLSLQNAVLK
jgi:predicted nucleic acid-binding protein